MSKKYIILFFLFAAIFIIAGCQTSSDSRYYFYHGNPGERENVSVIVMGRYLYPVGLSILKTGENLWPFTKDQPSPMSMPYTFDIQPGGYTLRTVFYNSGKTVGDAVEIDINAQPGMIYFLYPETLPNNTWRLHLKEFSSSDDLVYFAKNGKNLRDRVEFHFSASFSQSVYLD